MWFLKPFAVVLTSLTLLACDPCIGTPSCESPHFTYFGEVVDHRTGSPVPSVEVAFEPAGGEVAAVTARTDRAGAFVLSFPAGSAASIAGRLRVRTPAGIEHLLEDVHLAAVRYRGDARVFPRLTTEPVLDRVWDIRRRGTDAVFAGGWAEFVRTGGAEIERDSVRGPISNAGYWGMLLRGPEQGTVTGELRVWSASGEQFTRILNEPLDIWWPAPYLGPLFIGPWLGFGARLVRESGEPLSGATVILRRIGGVRTAQTEHVVTTNEVGTLPFHGFIVLEAGTLELDIFVTIAGEPQLRAEGVLVEAEERDDYYAFGDIVVR